MLHFYNDVEAIFNLKMKNSDPQKLRSPKPVSKQ